jgi:hypothetical protein
MSLTVNELTPWYKQFWPWFLMALPASAVVAGIATVVIAMTNPDGLVKDDYYKAGLGINRTLEREQQAAALGRFVCELFAARGAVEALRTWA